MRVLCFHGFRTSGLILKEQMRTLIKSLNTNSSAAAGGDWDFTFVDAPNACAKDAKIDEGVQLAFPRQLALGVYEWYNANTNKATGAVEYAALPHSIAFVREYLQTHGPFDVLLGFSQGGTFAWMVNAMIESGEIPLECHKRPKLVVMLNSMAPRDDKFAQILALGSSTTPVLQAFGAKDKLIDPDSWTRQAGSLSSSSFLPRIITEEIHAVPRTTLSCKLVTEAMRASAERRWYAFDFDGVLCDSARETGITALICLKKLVPASALEGFTDEELVQLFCRARPLLETGFEAIVILHRLAVGKERVEEMLASSTPVEDMERALLAMSCSKQHLMDLFKLERDAWIARDELGWLDANSFYAPAMDTIKALWMERQASVYVVTTKHPSFARTLLERAGLKNFPDERLFGLGSGKKRDVLEMLARSREARLGGSCVFVEDRVETLRDVASKGKLPVQLILAGYGYNTARDQKSAEECGFTVCATGDTLKAMLLQ